MDRLRMDHTTTESPPSKSLRISRGTTIRSATVETIECDDLSDLLRYIKANRSNRKGSGYICVAEMYGTRSKGNALPTRIVGLDYDHMGVGQDMSLITRLRELNLSAIYWSTHSHRPESPRMRVLVEVEDPVDPAEYRSAWHQVVMALGSEYMADRSTCHPDQPLFLPSPRAMIGRTTGQPMKLGPLLKTVEKEKSEVLLDPLPKELNPVDVKVLKSRPVQAVIEKVDSYQSRSDYDFALFTELARQVGKDVNRIWRIAAFSGTWRDKWERDDYVVRTINAALTAVPGPKLLDWSDLDKKTLAYMEKHQPAPTSWILPQLLARGATSFIVGRPKGGKSTLALQMGLAACGSTELWTSWEAYGFPPSEKPLNVLYLDLEQSDSLASQSVQRLKIRQGWPTNFWRFDNIPVLDDAGLDILEGYIKHLKLDLVIVDTWLRVDPSDLMGGRNVFANQGSSLQRITALAHRLNIHICMLVHAGKRTDPTDPSMQVAGTSAMTASVDDILVVSYADDPSAEDGSDEASSRRLLTMMGRNYGNSGSKYLIERQNGRLEMLGVEWQVSRNLNQQGVLDVLANGMEMTTSEVAEASGRSRPATSRSLAQLERAGRVERLGRRGWRLVGAVGNPAGD